MAVLDKFRDMFSGNTTAPKAEIVDPSIANPTVPGAGTPGSDGKVAAIPASGEGEKSPLEGFAKLWQKEDTDQKPLQLTPTFTVDPAKLRETAKGVDFVKAVSPAALEAAKNGDSSLLVNEAVQLGYAKSAEATAAIVQKALQDQATMFRDTILPEALRRNQVTNTLRSDNALLNNPAAQPVITMLEQQMAVKYPNATAAEVSSKAKDYLSEFAMEMMKSTGKVVSDKPAEGANNPLGREPEDWTKFFGI